MTKFTTINAATEETVATYDLMSKEAAFAKVEACHDVSDEIIGHKRVRSVTMTGSDGVGRHTGQKATRHLKKSVLELGSNDAYLVLEDADVELAVKTCVQGGFTLSIETSCCSFSQYSAGGR